MATRRLKHRQHAKSESPEWGSSDEDEFASPGPGAMIRGPRMQLDDIEVLRLAVSQNPTSENVMAYATVLNTRLQHVDSQFSQLVTAANASVQSVSRGVKKMSKSVRKVGKKMDEATVTIENMDEKADRAAEQAERDKAEIKKDMGKFATYMDRCIQELSEDVAATLEQDKGWLDKWTTKKKGMIRHVYVFLRAIGRLFHKMTGYYLVAREFIIKTLYKMLSMIPGLSALFNVEELVRLLWFSMEMLWITGIVNSIGALKGRPFLGYETISYVLNLVWGALGTLKSVFEFLFINPVIHAFDYFTKDNWFLIKCAQWYKNIKMIFDMLLEWALDGKKMVYETATYMKDSALNATSTYVTQPIANAASRTAESAYYYASPVVTPVANAASTYVGQPIASVASRAAEGVSYYGTPVIEGIKHRLPSMPSLSWRGKLSKRKKGSKKQIGGTHSILLRKHQFLTPSRGFRGQQALLLNVPVKHHDEVIAIQPIYDYAITYVHQLMEEPDMELSETSKIMLEHLTPPMDMLLEFFVTGKLPMKEMHGKLKRLR
jgi:hypothetical protein